MHSRLLFWWISEWKSRRLELSDKCIIVFSPHQDDETLGCGGLIAMKRERGVRVAVVFLTDGAASEGIEIPVSRDLANIRRGEALSALKILGVPAADVYFLNKADGMLHRLNEGERQHAVKQLTTILNHYQPGEVYVPHRRDSHKDHQATYHLVMQAVTQAKLTVDVLQYHIWLFWSTLMFISLKLDDIAAAYNCPIASVQIKKREAMACYVSQAGALPPGFANGFMGATEIYFKVKC